MKLVIFGVSNMLGDVIDCAMVQGISTSHIVMNQEEVIRPRTKSVSDRIALLSNPPKVIGFDDFEPQSDQCYFLGTTAAGRDKLVKEIRSRFDIECCTLVHPTAYVSSLSQLANGVFVGAGSIVGPGVQLKEHVFVNRKVSVGHDTVIEAYSRLQPGCNLGGHIHVGNNVTVGMGSNIIEELEIGAGCVIAAGSAVIKDVPENVLMAGVPAQLKKTLP